RAVAVDLELVRIHNEIQLLDRAWDTACKRHLQRDRNGEYLEPGSALKYVTLSIIVALGIAVVFAGMAAGSVPGSMAGVIGAALGLFFIWRETKARAEYDRAFNSYQKKRQSLLLSLKEAGKP
ncbi:MAG TPA: hypothetical protein VEJ63_05090, partial [Planctomycetota bacterium]|nr:hypothetical protein [Planctomycetota bacterium]